MEFSITQERADAYSESLALRQLHNAHHRPIRHAPRIRWYLTDPEPDTGRTLSECGTPTAYRAHCANGERCDECTQWNRDRARRQRQQRKNRAA